MNSSVLTVDCGGSGIKFAVLDDRAALLSAPRRVPTPYPLSPDRLIELIADQARTLPGFDRLTIGMPGMIRQGIVVGTPHYICAQGPRTTVVPGLVEQWFGLDFATVLGNRFGVPAMVLNDAEVHGAAVVSGRGLELVLTLGTGLGSAHFDHGRLAPHLEVSRAPIRLTTYDQYVGEPERRRLGNALWSRRVRRVVDSLRPVFVWDRVYLGGGNAAAISPKVLGQFGDDVTVVQNSAGLTGGVRAWQLGAGTPAWAAQPRSGVVGVGG